MLFAERSSEFRGRRQPSPTDSCCLSVSLTSITIPYVEKTLQFSAQTTAPEIGASGAVEFRNGTIHLLGRTLTIAIADHVHAVRGSARSGASGDSGGAERIDTGEP